MKIFSRLFFPLICLTLILLTITNLEEITSKIIPLIVEEPQIIYQKPNAYKKDDTFLFVQNVDKFEPLSKGDIINIFYTIVNSGYENMNFYCPKEYTNCLDDVRTIAKDQELMTHINNFVHPFNSFRRIESTSNESGQVNINVTYFYTKDHIEALNKKVDEIYNEIITDDMDTITKIKTIHDYIINTTRYDINRNDNGDSSYQSYLAYGTLYEGYATCNGYTDAMALFLEKLDIPNFKVAMTPDDLTKEGHVWNAVYLNDTWLHLDLTWDDPVSTDNKDYLLDKYFLITTEQLEENDSSDVLINEHQFKKNIYLEFK